MDAQTAQRRLLKELQKKHKDIFLGGSTGKGDGEKTFIYILYKEGVELPEDVPKTHEGYQVSYWNTDL